MGHSEETGCLREYPRIAGKDSMSDHPTGKAVLGRHRWIPA
jgi:hypothetical protein